ncbi:DinB family protein [Mucilaginibacter xinganensis]|uniref:DinB-like domain-containing protein n=1 Tax=Mucilaginibacter xinganensis TaxID=1234841 RepID=A0A223P1A5_9SPHI|nr:DinB family protein [Mucilaginibacter xinganensis]ASU35923.1 hypothetical protein MuYL_4038 [Mucilaginibacter xinganensis]
MSKAIETIKTIRASTVKLVEGLSNEQLNKVPEGFINNIIWNLGHMVAAQQGICYKRSGIEARIDDSFFERYKPGTKPEGHINEAEVEEIKALLVSTIDQLETDFKESLFKEYPAFTTRYGVELASVEDAINFLPFHDGLHMGYIMALKRAI